MLVEQNKGFEVVSYSNLSDFYKYIYDTPFNEAFRWAKHGSVEYSHRFTQTKNFEEATELFKNGWSDMSQKLTQKLKVKENETAIMTKRRNIYDVVGYQCSVPRYLQGVPTSMVRTVNTPIKQKVITLVKAIAYSSYVTIDEIVEESTKALQIVKKLEAQGYKINLDICMGAKEEKKFMVRVRIKSASERLNVSKLAFPLVHPSMLRRLMFRWIEVHPTVTKDFVDGYGSPAVAYDYRSVLKPNEYLLPNFVRKDVSKISNIDDLENL